VRLDFRSRRKPSPHFADLASAIAWRFPSLRQFRSNHRYHCPALLQLLPFPLDDPEFPNSNGLRNAEIREGEVGGWFHRTQQKLRAMEQALDFALPAGPRHRMGDNRSEFALRLFSLRQNRQESSDKHDETLWRLGAELFDGICMSFLNRFFEGRCARPRLHKAIFALRHSKLRKHERGIEVTEMLGDHGQGHG
jgi:hypothetical protein